MNTKKKHFCCLLVLALIGDCCSGAKILAVFPLPFSHFGCDNAVMRSLSDAGHEVTVITSFPQRAALENYTKVIDASVDVGNFVIRASIDVFRRMSISEVMNYSIMFEEPFCDRVYNLKEYQDIMNSQEKPFDVIFIEIFYLYKCYLPVAQKLQVPVIGVTTVMSWYLADRAVGNVRHPINVPHELASTWNFHTFYERFINIWYHLVTEYVWYTRIVPFTRRFYKRYENKLIPYSGFLDIEPVLVFYNSHHSVLPRPLNPNVIEIGGIHIKPLQRLPEEIRKFVEEAENGAILFNLAAVVRTSSSSYHITKTFANAFARIPQRVIWIYQGQINGNISSNVMLKKWAPQSDILEHSNVKAFISHCVQAEMYEAIYAATPVVALPLMFDQPANAEFLTNLGAAVQVDIESLSEEDVINAINSIVNNTKYYRNMQNLSKIFKDRPITSQQSVVYWTEYVIRRGASNLKPPSSQLYWFQYFLLDVICFVIICSICIIYFVYGCFNIVIKLCNVMTKARNKNKLD